MRFAVRRPATRPVTPRGQRPPGGDGPTLPAVSPGHDVAVRSGVPATVMGRRALARFLTAPADLGPSGARPGEHGERAASGPATGWAAFEGLSAPAARREAPGPTVERQALQDPYVPRPAVERQVLQDSYVPGSAAGRRALQDPYGLGVLTGRTAFVPVEAAYGPEVLEPTRVTPGPPATCPPGETVHRLGETTDRLLRHHLREGRSRRPSLPDAPSGTTEIPGRERRSLPGVQARALTPRGR